MSIRKRLIAALLIVLFWNRTGSVFANDVRSGENGSRIAILGFRDSRSPQELKFRTELQNRLKGETKLPLIEESLSQKVYETLSREDILPALKKMAEARKRLKAGKEAYDALSLENSVKFLSQAVLNYREGIAAVRQNDKNNELLLAHLYLGMSYIFLGKEEDGKRYIEEMVVLDNDRRTRSLSSKEFSPQIIKIHREATKKIVGGPHGVLNLTLEPVDTKVYVDGFEISQETLKAGYSLPVGEHFIVADQPGYRAYSKSIRVRPGDNPYTITMEAWQPYGPYAVERRTSSIALDDLNTAGKEAAAGILLLGSIVPVAGSSDVTILAQLYDTRTQEFSSIVQASAPAAKPEAQAKFIAKELSNRISKDQHVVADVSKTNPNVPSFNTNGRNSNFPSAVEDYNQTPIYKKWWFWSAVGGAAILGGAAAYFLLLKEDPSPAIVINNPF